MKTTILAILLTACFIACSSQEDIKHDTYSGSKPSPRATYTLSSWMKDIPNEKLISKLSIPGTHDTGAYVTGGPMIITQDLTIGEQLNAGIRALDIRIVAVNNDHLEIFHGISAQNLNFEYDILNTAITFLKENPSETIIMTLRKELEDRNSPAGYVAILRQILQKPEYTSYIVKQFSGSLTLGDLRGKILFLSRNNLGTPYIGGVFSGWADNTTFTRSIIGENASATVHVEDYYRVGTILSSDINRKRNYICANLSQASQNTSKNNDWYITFTSGTGAGAYPNAVAARINKFVADYISQQNLTSCGIVFIDFAGWEDSKKLISTIINCNSQL